MKNVHEQKKQSETDTLNLLALKKINELSDATEPQIQKIGKDIICTTDYRPRKRSREEIVLDATEGFIPLWAKNSVLRWRFNVSSFSVFQQPEALKEAIRDLLTQAILAWGDSVPIRFTENPDNADFEIIMEKTESCTPQGCSLARAFFPDSGRHQLVIFPTIFEQEEKERIDTMAHEIGHIFGLRHFFAPEIETAWPSVIFGAHRPFSIMNYGEESELTETDIEDLKNLYQAVWDGQLTQINGTPIKLVLPYHALNEGTLPICGS